MPSRLPGQRGCRRPLACDTGSHRVRPPAGTVDRRMGAMKLLVSVRDAAEAVVAAGAGVDLLDVKEPDAGPLGCAGAAAIAEIASVAASSGVPLSAALGELREWTGSTPLSLPSDLMFAKVGLSGLQGEADWPSRWRLMRDQWEQHNGRRISWIAVAYADAEFADAPPLACVLREAIAAQCAGLLIDTWGKAGGTLWEHLSTQEMEQALATARDAGLLTAVAGRVALADLHRVAGLGAEVVAVRSAVCAGGDRRRAVDGAAVDRFRHALRAANSRMPTSETAAASSLRAAMKVGFRVRTTEAPHADHGAQDWSPLGTHP